MARLDLTAGRGAINALAENTAKMHAMHKEGMNSAFNSIIKSGDILTQWHLREVAKADKEEAKDFREREFAQKQANDERNFIENQRQFDKKFAQDIKNLQENQRQFNANYALKAKMANADLAHTSARTQSLNLQNEQQALQNAFWRRGLKEVEVQGAIPRINQQGEPIVEKTTLVDYALKKQNNGEELSASEQLILNTMGLGEKRVNASGELETRSRSAKNKVLDEVRDLEKVLRSIEEIKKESPTAGVYNGIRRGLFNATGGAIGMNNNQDRLAAAQRNFRDALMKTNYGAQLSKQKIEDIDKFFNKGFQSEETLNNYLDGLQTEILFAYENAGKKLADFRDGQKEATEIFKNLENYRKGSKKGEITRLKEEKKALNVRDYLQQN